MPGRDPGLNLWSPGAAFAGSSGRALMLPSQSKRGEKPVLPHALGAQHADQPSFVDTLYAGYGYPLICS